MGGLVGSRKHRFIAESLFDLPIQEWTIASLFLFLLLLECVRVFLYASTFPILKYGKSVSKAENPGDIFAFPCAIISLSPMWHIYIYI